MQGAANRSCFEPNNLRMYARVSSQSQFSIFQRTSVIATIDPGAVVEAQGFSTTNTPRDSPLTLSSVRIACHSVTTGTHTGG